MKRLVVAAVPFLAAAMLFAGPVSATAKHHVSCKQIRAELAAGKKPDEVASDLKVSKSAVSHCSAKVASSKQHTGSTGTQHEPPAQH